MASFTTHGLDELELSLAEIAAMPDAVLGNMLDAMATVVEKAQKQSAQTILAGPHSKGITAGAFKRKNKKRASVEIVPDGMRSDGNKRRIAEVAFINEFGKRGQPARPFIATANESCADESVEAAAKVHDQWLTSKGF